MLRKVVKLVIFCCYRLRGPYCFWCFCDCFSDFDQESSEPQAHVVCVLEKAKLYDHLWRTLIYDLWVCVFGIILYIPILELGNWVIDQSGRVHIPVKLKRVENRSTWTLSYTHLSFKWVDPFNPFKINKSLNYPFIHVIFSINT